MAHGEANETYDMYSLSPFRSPGWRGGLYFAVGSYLASSLPHSRVYCELLVTTDPVSYTHLTLPTICSV